MRKGSIIALCMVAFLVTASVDNPEPKEVFRPIAKQSSHVPPAEKLPDYGELKKITEAIKKENYLAKKKNDSLSKLLAIQE